jgi:hypothetical protein
MKVSGLAFLPLLLAACSSELPVAPTSIGASFSKANPNAAIVRSVTGTALRSLPDPDAHGWRSFMITALERKDGSVSGQFEIHLRQLDVRIHGRITCAGIVGNAAWVGGVIELKVGEFPGFPGPGTPMRIRVVDNGEGRHAPPDLVSGLGTFNGMPEGVELAYCATRPNQPILSPVEAGGIQVRG